MEFGANNSEKPMRKGAQRRAVVDVGTNSVKLLVAEVTGHVVIPICEESRQTRLGEGFYTTHKLQPEPITRTADAVKVFADKARNQGVNNLRVIATSAARDAENGAELIQAIERASGLALEIISGDQEAEWAFQGVTSNPDLAGLRLLIMDLGGGSAEFILGDRGHARFSQSFPLGCVRLLEKLRPPEHPTATDLSRCRDFIGAFLAERVAPVLEPLLARSSHETILVGTGGTATILARMESKMAGFEREKIEAVRLNRKTVHRWMEHLWSLPLTERKMVVGLPANRADVILLGTAIYATVMAAFALHELRISTRGLRFAALMDAKKSR